MNLNDDDVFLVLSVLIMVLILLFVLFILPQSFISEDSYLLKH